MPLTLQRRELKGAFVYFIPEGTSVAGSPVAKGSWPSASPTSNYTDWLFQDTETLVRERKVDDRMRLVPSTAGGYTEDIEKSVKSLSFIGTTAKTNSILKQLENGTLAAVAVGVPQSPLGDRSGSLDGVCLIELMDESTQTVVERWQVWARLSIDEASGASPEVSVLTFRLLMLEASLNTYQAN